MEKPTREDALKYAAARQDQRVVFVSGNFNVIHPGHLRLLRFARESGDCLLVGINSDAVSRSAILNQWLRLESFQSISWVDFAFILDEAPEEFIAELKPDVVVKGAEHEQAENPEAAAVEDYGGRLIFGSGDVRFSSLDIIQKEWRDLNYSTIRKSPEFPTRHGFVYDDLVGIIQRYKDLKVLVIGDSIVDEYINCEPLGMSQEDPTIVVTPVVSDKFAGGAAIVAAHARGLGAKVTFFSVCGNDDTATFLRNTMEKFHVNAHLYADTTRPTTLKQRFRAGTKTLLRVSHLRGHSIHEDLRTRILKDLIEELKDADLVVFSDFNYGMLPQPVVNRVIEECQKRGIKMVADSQSSSQVGDISRFRGMSLVTPTEREARLAVHDFDSGLVALADKLTQEAEIENVVVTLGSEGVLVHSHPPDGDETKLWTDRIGAMNVAPKDVAGAGDSFLISASMALAVSGDIWKSAYIGSIGAACQVGRIGNVPLRSEEIIKELREP